MGKQSKGPLGDSHECTIFHIASASIAERIGGFNICAELGAGGAENRYYARQCRAFADCCLDFAGDGSVGQDLASVITADLERSGLFRPVDREAFIERNIGVNVRPRFGDWRVINALALVTGRAVQHSDGRLLVEFRLWDVVAEEQMAGLQFYDTGKLAAHRAFGG